MKTNDNTNLKTDKNTKWFLFVVGILVGLVLGFSFYFVDKYLFNEKIKFSKTIDNLYKPLQHKKKQETHKVIVQNTLEKQDENQSDIQKTDLENRDIQTQTESTEMEITDPSLTETEFMFTDEIPANDLQEVEMVSDVLLTEKNIPVQYYSEGEDSVKVRKESYFKVELWSSAIKNRYTYQLKGKVLKIKGIDINYVKIVYLEGDYFLQYNDTYYELNQNAKFEKLIEKKIPKGKE